MNGSGSKWTNSGTLYVGNLGIGTLDISGGGAVSDTIGYLGYAASSTGVAVVKAPGRSGPTAAPSTWAKMARGR